MPVTLEEKAKQFIHEQDGKIQVDWKNLAKHERDANLMGRTFRNIMDNILQYLHEKGILVYEQTPGSYFGIGANVLLHPRLSESLIRFSFADEKNAREYYSQFFKEALYGVSLYKTIGDVEKASD